MDNQNQYRKEPFMQASEILGHVKNRDYGMAEIKAEILFQRLVHDKKG